MHVWLIGAGSMAQDYAKVLLDLGPDLTVVGRGEGSAAAFREATGVDVVTGGLAGHLAKGPKLPDAAIVSVGVEQLAPTTALLLDAGVRRVLVEKPGGLDSAGIAALADKADALGAEVVLGYNRRFYASVLAAREAIAEDGGVTSFTFEFTEWSHVIATLQKPREVFDNWFLANSTHVVDMAFFLGGTAREVAAFRSGALPWHPRGAAFTGAGLTGAGVPFSYHANWAAPGRWGVEVLTAKRRFIFRPLEQLQVQELGSVAITPVAIDDSLDKAFKPGLHRQTAAFLEGRTTDFCTLREQVETCRIYDRICPRPVPDNNA